MNIVTETSGLTLNPSAGGTCPGKGRDPLKPRLAVVSKRKSRGPGLRLSWPSHTNTKRAIVAKLPSRVKKGYDHPTDSHIVHQSYVDVEMHRRLMRADPAPSDHAVLQPPMTWDPQKLADGHRDLLQYFQHKASRALAIFSGDPTKLGDVLLRTALTDSTPLSKAVLHSILAFSSLHRHGMAIQPAELKISALRALAAAPGAHIGTEKAVQHVAAAMLLSSFETHQASCTSGQWTWYLGAVKRIIKDAGLDNLSDESDVGILLDWVYYHDVLAHFSSRHWHRHAADLNTLNPSCANIETSVAFPLGETPWSPGRSASNSSSALVPIQLLSDICDAVPAQPDDGEKKDLGGFFKILDWRIRSMQVFLVADDASLAAELYRLAMLVYLDQASGNALKQTARTKDRVDRAFALMGQLRTCPRQFPIFIFGCEARTEDQRAAVLDLIARSEQDPSSRSFVHAKLLMQAVWAQDDLAERELNYFDKISYVVSCCKIMPIFV